MARVKEARAGVVRELPQVCVDGKWYYVDERLVQIRNVEDPYDFHTFSDVDELWAYVNNGWEE